jgi:hypothetical protein
MKRNRLKVVIDVTDDGKLVKLRVRERSRDGKYIPLQRAWREKDLIAIKTGAKAINLLAKGVSDTDDVRATVNATRRSRRPTRRHQTKPLQSHPANGDGGSKPLGLEL